MQADQERQIYYQAGAQLDLANIQEFDIRGLTEHLPYEQRYDADKPVDGQVIEWFSGYQTGGARGNQRNHQHEQQLR